MEKYRHGGEVYNKEIQMDFSININPFGIPEPVKKVLGQDAAVYERYPDDECMELRRAIAEKEQVDADMILCGNGAADLIYRFCLALHPERALLPVPTFSEYKRALELAGCKVENYFLEEKSGFLPGKDFLAAAKKAPVLFLCNPNNPSGRRVPPDLLNELIQLAMQGTLILAADECFLEFTEDWERYSLIKKTGSTPNIIVFKAFTKTYAMAGLRLGYCVCGSRALLSDMKQAGPPWNVSIPAQSAGVAAMGVSGYLEKTRSYLTEERSFLMEELRKLGFRVYPSDANYILFRAFPELYEDMLAKKILLRQCADYPGLGADYYRICVAGAGQNRRLVSTLKEYFAAHPWAGCRAYDEQRL